MLKMMFIGPVNWNGKVWNAAEVSGIHFDSKLHWNVMKRQNDSSRSRFDMEWKLLKDGNKSGQQKMQVKEKEKNTEDEDDSKFPASDSQLKAFDMSRKVFLLIVGSMFAWAASKLFYQRQVDQIWDALYAKFNPQIKKKLHVNDAFATALLQIPLIVAVKTFKMPLKSILEEEQALRPKSVGFFVTSEPISSKKSAPSPIQLFLNQKTGNSSIDSLNYPKELSMNSNGGSQSVVLDVGDRDILNWLIYCRMHVICARLLSPAERRLFMKSVGFGLLDTFVGGLNIPVSNVGTDWRFGVESILEGLQTNGFCSSYKLEMSAFESDLFTEEGQSRFTLYCEDVATMSSSQTLAGESYNDLAPIFVSDIIGAYLERCGIRSDHEDFYIDNSFQRNPFAYDPTGIVIQFNIELAQNN